MKLHIIVDFMHIYYKYFFQMRENRLKRLSATMTINNETVEKDTSLIYYTLRDIEGIRKELENIGHDVTMSICVDSKSARKESGVSGAEEYKANRVNRLTEEDLLNISIIQDLLKKAGHNVYKIDGYEADDIINYLVHKFSNDFDYSVIYTNDKDILINICDKVGVMRFKQKVGYTQVDMNNYEAYLEKEFGTFIPYNALGLFLSSVGDTADRIKGINKFGKVAFSKLITKVASKYKINWKICGDYAELEKVVDKCKEFLTDEQFEELKNSFALVSNMNITGDLEFPSNKSNVNKRTEAYEPLLMVSLIA